MQRTRLLLALLGCLLTSASAQENLIRNPGFEGAPGTNGLPGSGWWLFEGLGETGVKLDRAVAHSGQASVRLQSKEPAKCVLVSPSFEVAPGDELRFEAWVRSEQSNTAATFAGLAFRHPDGRILERAYVRSSAADQGWVLISGTAKAPEGASTAEMHLGYTNAPGALWYDDVAAVITSPVSFSLIEGAKPWAGEQEIALRIVNRQTNQFRGSISALMGKQTRTVPVALPSNSSHSFKVPLTFSGVGAHDYKISLLDEAGAPLRVLQGKFRTPPALVLFPPCPCYHLAGTSDGATRIDARLNLNPARPQGLKFTVRLSDASGQPIQSLEADASNGDAVGVNLHVPTPKIGAFKVTSHLLDAAGHDLAGAENEVHVIEKETAQVILGADGFLRVAGKPEFPIGMYNCGHYEEMAKAGFDATHEYGITTGEADAAINSNDIELQQLLDKSWANRMRMMVEFPRKAIEKAKWEQIRRRIETFRHHPGLLCWGSEERVARGTCPLSHVAQLYALAHELDPDHPLVLGDTRDVIQKLQQDRRDFFPDACMDVGIWWWYPIPLKEPDGNGLEGGANSGQWLEAPSWLTTTHSRKPLWIAIQAYQKPSQDARFPTPTEYRCQAYMSIIAGAKGLFFYVGSGQKDYQGKPAGLLNKPVEAHWDYVQQLARELRELSPVIMAPCSPAKLELAPTNAPVEFITRQLEGKLYLLAANKSGQSQQVRFTGEALRNRTAHTLYEDQAAKVDGDTLADEFPAFGVHVYRLE